MTDLNLIRNAIIGNVCVAIGMACTGINEVLTRYWGIAIVQVMTMRFGVQLCISAGWWAVRKPTSPYVIKPAGVDSSEPATVHNWYGDTPFIVNIWLRALLYSVCIPLFWYGVLTLPLGDVNCIFYLEPLMAIYAAHLILGERLPPWYILIPATILAVCGLLLVSQPPFLTNLFSDADEEEETSVSGVVATVLSAVGWTITILLIRTSQKVHFLQLEIAATIMTSVVMGPLVMILNRYVIDDSMIGDWDMADWDFSWSGLLGVILMGCFGFTNLAFLNIGYQLADAALVGWMEYLQIPISYLYQTFIFGDTPNTFEIVGAVAVTVGSILPVVQQLYVYCSTRVASENEGEGETAGESTPLIHDTGTVMVGKAADELMIDVSRHCERVERVECKE